jgi:tetratricopeptide (TPR) repeat protein
MGTMLNLANHLLDSARKFQQLGRHQDALLFLTRLTGLRELPAPIADEAQSRLAELHLRRRKYKQARRHLTAALIYQPQSARYHYLMAQCIAKDEKEGTSERAAHYYRKSLALDPDQPACLAEFGLLAVRMGEYEEAYRSLQKAVELAPADAGILGKLVRGLQEMGRQEDARQAIRLAMFRNPRNDRFRRLWDDFQFQELHRQQRAQRNRGSLLGDLDEPIILPFVRPTPSPSDKAPNNKIIRRDRPSLPRPHAPRLDGVPGESHA